MHISIEGFDGVGKSTICSLIADRIGYTFIEKPLHYLFDNNGEMDNYIRIRNRVNSNPDRVFTAWFYGLSNIFLYSKYKNKNIITDRHIVSNYAWSGKEENIDIYNLIIKKIGKPDLTIILYCNREEIEKRLKKRNQEDDDFKKIHLSEQIYKKMTEFCKDQDLPHVIIDSSNLSVEDVVDKILVELDKYEIKY